MITQPNLDIWFTYHAPTAAQVAVYEELRAAAKVYAETIYRLTPVSADQTAAVRKVRESLMTANAAIACRGR